MVMGRADDQEISRSIIDYKLHFNYHRLIV